jgi:hypothetical protein
LSLREVSGSLSCASEIGRKFERDHQLDPSPNKPKRRVAWLSPAERPELALESQTCPLPCKSSKVGNDKVPGRLTSSSKISRALEFGHVFSVGRSSLDRFGRSNFRISANRVFLSECPPSRVAAIEEGWASVFFQLFEIP